MLFWSFFLTNYISEITYILVIPYKGVLLRHIPHMFFSIITTYTTHIDFIITTYTTRI